MQELGASKTLHSSIPSPLFRNSQKAQELPGSQRITLLQLPKVFV